MSNPKSTAQTASKLMTKTAAARIQSSTAKLNGGKVAAGSFAARAMSSAAKNESK